MSITADATMVPRGTPLYGQPSWWGDGDADDENSFKQESKSSSKKHDGSLSGGPSHTSSSWVEFISAAVKEPKSASASLEMGGGGGLIVPQAGADSSLFKSFITSGQSGSN